MSKAVDIIVDQFVDKAVRQGLIMPTRAHPTPDAWKQELQKAFETYSGSQARRAAQGWYNSLVAAQTKNRYGRQMDLVEMTSPNMIGFFPEYDPNARHSNFAITMFDTETADKNTDIIEAAGFKLIYNKDAKRFERLPSASVSNSQFYGVYNPKDASYVQTEQVHGRNSHMLVSLDGKITTGWDSNELERFKNFSKGTVLAGHNIMNADLSWIHGKPTEGFKFMEPEFKQGILDTLHLSAALLGRGEPGEQRNALQKLAQRFKVNDELPGLPAHAGWADTIKNVKVLEHLLAIDHPATQEFIEAMDTGNRHSHYWENPDPLHNSGFVTHGISQKAVSLGAIGNALKKVSVKVKEKILKDVPAALGIDREDYYNGNWDKSSYEEMSMAQDDEEIKEYLQKTYGHLGAGGGPQWSLHMEEMLRDIAGNLHYAKLGARSQLIRDIKGMSEADARYVIRNRSFGGDELSILREKRLMEQKDSAKETAAEYRQLRRRSGKFLSESAAAGFAKADWFQDLREAHRLGTLTEDILAEAQNKRKKTEVADKVWRQTLADKETKDAKLAAQQEHLGLQSTLDTWNELERRKKLAEAKEDRFRAQRWDSQRFWARQDVSQRLEMRDARQQAQKAYQQGYLFHGDIGSLESKVAVGTKAYREELDKLIDRNKKILTVTRAMASVPFFNPMQLFRDISNQGYGIRYAAHGILPQFAERPIFRFGNALGNLWGQFRSSVETKYGMASAAAPVAGALGTLGLSLIPGVGPLAAVAGGQVLGGGINLASQMLGLGARNKINQYGEGIQHRLNLLGMTTSVLGAFINGLKACIGLFGKLSSLWSYMPSYTMSTLTGVAWNKASGMAVADRLLGFQEGTVSNQYTKLAYQQADLYTSGQYNEQSLVAAARLGIFDLAYAPTGGDVEQQQADIYDRLYKRIYESGLNKAEVQSQLSLIKNYSPEMASMLERGHGLVKAGYTQYRDYKAFQSMFGYDRLSDGENARVSVVSSRWGAARTSMSQGVALAGSRAYDLLDDLIIKPINKVLWDFARNGKIDWEAIVKIINDIIDKLGDIDLKGVNWDKLLSMFDPLGEKIKAKLQGIFGPLGQFVTELGMTKIEFHKENLLGWLTGDKTFADVVSFTSPTTMAKEVVQNAQDVLEEAGIQANRSGGAWYDYRDKFVKHRKGETYDRTKYAKILDNLDVADGRQRTMYASVLDSLMTSNKELINSHDIAVWDEEGMNRSLLMRAVPAAVKEGLLPAEVGKEFIKDVIMKDYEATGQIREAAGIATAASADILQRIEHMIEQIFLDPSKQNKVELKIEDKTKSGISVDAENVFGGAAANMNMGFEMRRQ